MYLTAVLVFLSICTITDLISRVIFKPAAYGFTILAVIAHLIQGDISYLSLFGGVLLGLLLLVVSWATKEAIGYGDGLTVMACGAALGFQTTFSLLLLSVLFAAVWAGALLVIKKAGRKDCFPFVPFLLAAQLCFMVIL